MSMRRISLMVLVLGIAACGPAPAHGSVTGRVVATPTCPVQRMPPDPRCAPKPVSGARLVLSDTHGKEVAEATSGDDGRFALDAPLGPGVLTALPVGGLLAPPAPVEVTVTEAGVDVGDLAYDTGIR